MAMINVNVLTEKIIANPDYIVKILEALGFDNIRDRGKYFQFPNKDGDNQNAISILKDTLVYNNYTRNDKGNLITLVMKEKNLEFPEALKWISKALSLSGVSTNVKIKKPFGGFYTSLKPDENDIDANIKTYPISMIENDLHRYNMMWYYQNVSFDIQDRFCLGYNLETNSILIPIFNTSGELVGCKARRNDSKCELTERWWAYLPFPKTQVVYGYHWNYQKIIEKDMCIIVESEKGVCQLSSMGCDLGLAVLGHDISQSQAKIIKSLKVKKIILALDEGLPEEEIKKQAEKLVIDTHIYKNKVGYIYDREHKYLKEGSKDSPTDNNKDTFDKLRKECVVWIN
jgi:DNA primase